MTVRTIRVGTRKGEVGRLVEAHEALSRVRPSVSADPADWIAFHEGSALVYGEIAEIDRGHHHEARYWAVRQREIAQEIRETGAVHAVAEVPFK